MSISLANSLARHLPSTPRRNVASYLGKKNLILNLNFNALAFYKSTLVLFKEWSLFVVLGDLLTHLFYLRRGAGREPWRVLV